MSLIDGDKLQKVLENILMMQRNLGANELEISTLQWAIDIVKNQPNIAPPPNDPLTLEELREMGGEPVWVQAAKAIGKIPARWMLFECGHKDRDLYLFTPASGITQGCKGENYGKTWLAYRRNPEGGGENV